MSVFTHIFHHIPSVWLYVQTLVHMDRWAYVVWTLIATQKVSFKQGSSDILFPSHILQLLLGDPEVIPGRMFNPSPSRKHHDQIHEPPQLAALNAKEQWFYTELFLDVWAHVPGPKMAASLRRKLTIVACILENKTQRCLNFTLGSGSLPTRTGRS